MFKTILLCLLVYTFKDTEIEFTVVTKTSMENALDQVQGLGTI